MGDQTILQAVCHPTSRLVVVMQYGNCAPGRLGDLYPIWLVRRAPEVVHHFMRRPSDLLPRSLISPSLHLTLSMGWTAITVSPDFYPPHFASCVSKVLIRAGPLQMFAKRYCRRGLETHGSGIKVLFADLACYMEAATAVAGWSECTNGVSMSLVCGL